MLVVIGVLTGLINPGNLKRLPCAGPQPGKRLAGDLALLIIVAVVAAAVSYFVVIIPSRHVTDTERSRVFAFIPLFIARAAF